MKAIVLAAGEGKRLRPYTLDRPKCLVEVAGRSLLDRQLEILNIEGITDITLVGGYRSEMLRRPDCKLEINAAYASTNMVATLFSAESSLSGETIISYGDIVYSREILRKLIDSSSDVCVIIDTEWEQYWRARIENPLDDAETLRMSAKNQILEIGQRPTSISEIEGQYIGLMKFSAEGTRMLKETFHRAEVSGSVRGVPIKSAYMTDLIQLMIDEGVEVTAVKVSGNWVEIDTVEDLTATITRKRLLSIELAR